MRTMAAPFCVVLIIDLSYSAFWRRRAELMYSGIAASCAATDTAIIAGMLTSYSTPISQLPRNQNAPKEHSNTP